MGDYPALSITADRDVFTVSAFGERWFTCPARIGVDGETALDRDEGFIPLRSLQTEKTDTGLRYIWRTSSNLWQEKAYVLEVEDTYARFFVRVRGRGRVERLRFFDSGARTEAAGYVLPIANHADYQRNIRMINEPGVIELGYFVPPSYCYPFYMADVQGFMGVGLCAREGQYHFHEFLYRFENGRCAFEVPLYGHIDVDGAWESQSLIFLTGGDAYDVIRHYAAWHYESGWCRRKDRGAEPSWWKGPIFCGWGEQGAIAARRGGAAKDQATQENYTWMSDELDRRGLDPKIIIIDDKWQDEYGAATPDKKKWPDMRAFVDREHGKGRRVLLWFKSWYPEGLREEECIEYLCTACGADPTSEAYRSRMAGVMHTLLSGDEGCLDCDGFKIDFANCMPLGRYVMPHEPVYGVELLKRFFVLVRSLAKAVKPDALINCSCAHPYFDEIVDQVRLHDYDGCMRNVVEVMTHRQRLCRAVMDGVLIDTDGGGTDSRRDYHRWLRAQPVLGIPSLYCLSENGAVPFDESDYAIIKDTWDEYQKNLI